MKIKLRFGEYKLAYMLFRCVKLLIHPWLVNTVVFDKVWGHDYEERIIDIYYMIQIGRR